MTAHRKALEEIVAGAECAVVEGRLYGETLGAYQLTRTKGGVYISWTCFDTGRTRKDPAATEYYIKRIKELTERCPHCGKEVSR